MVKNLPAKQTRTLSLGWEDPQSRKWQPTPVFLFKEFHGQRSLDGYSPWDHKELDTTERLTHTHTHTHTHTVFIEHLLQSCSCWDTKMEMGKIRRNIYLEIDQGETSQRRKQGHNTQETQNSRNCVGRGLKEQRKMGEVWQFSKQTVTQCPGAQCLQQRL